MISGLILNSGTILAGMQLNRSWIQVSRHVTEIRLSPSGRGRSKPEVTLTFLRLKPNRQNWSMYAGLIKKDWPVVSAEALIGPATQFQALGWSSRLTLGCVITHTF